MSQFSAIPAQLRERAGKGAARAVRRAGRVPGVVYGDKKDPVMLSLDPRDLWRELNRSGFYARVFDVKIDEESHRCLARDVQFHPVTDQPTHVDFMRVGADATLEVEIPVHFLNQDRCPGLKDGGVLNIVRHEIEMECNVNNIPDDIKIDLLPYKIGDSIHISMVKLPEGAKPTITDRDFTIATIAPPAGEAKA